MNTAYRCRARPLDESSIVKQVPFPASERACNTKPGTSFFWEFKHVLRMDADGGLAFGGFEIKSRAGWWLERGLP